MLGKLLKHEFKATGRVVMPVLALLVGVTALMTLTGPMYWKHIENGDSSGVLGMVVGIMTFSILLAVSASITVFNSIGRFHRNVLGDEGYLTHTLPVTAGQNLLARLIVSVTWTIVSLFVAFLSIGVISHVVSGTNILKTIGNALRYIFTDFGPKEIFSVAVAYISALSGICLLYLWIFASMSIGYSSNRRRVAISALVAFGLNLIRSSLDSAVLYGAELGIEEMNLIRLAVNVVECVVLFFAARYFLSKRLNLQ